MTNNAFNQLHMNVMKMLLPITSVLVDYKYNGIMKVKNTFQDIIYYRLFALFSIDFFLGIPWINFAILSLKEQLS